MARAGELLDSVVHNMFIVGLMVPAATDLPRGAAAHRITEALGRLDDVVREVRDQVLAERGQGIRPGRAWRPPPDVVQRSPLARNRSASLRQRLTQTAHALHVAAADTAKHTLTARARCSYVAEADDRWAAESAPGHHPGQPFRPRSRRVAWSLAGAQARLLTLTAI